MSTVKVAYSVDVDTVIPFKSVCEAQGLIPTKVISGFMQAFVAGDVVWIAGRVLPPTSVSSNIGGSFVSVPPPEAPRGRGRPSTKVSPVADEPPRGTPEWSAWAAKKKAEHGFKLPAVVSPEIGSITEDPSEWVKGVGDAAGYIQRLHAEEAAAGLPPGCREEDKDLLDLWGTVDVKLKQAIRAASDERWMEQVRITGTWDMDTWWASRGGR
jgi:hypothetical protein